MFFIKGHGLIGRATIREVSGGTAGERMERFKSQTLDRSRAKQCLLDWAGTHDRQAQDLHKVEPVNLPTQMGEGLSFP